jgi:exopolysaccharide biosynthesis protein
MGNNNYFNESQSDRGRSGNNDYFSDPYRRARHVSVNSGRGGEGGGRKRNKKRRAPVALAIAIDVIIGALVLLVFYITNYVITPDVEGVALSTPSGVTSAATVSPPATVSGKTSPAPTGSKTTAPSATPTASAEQSSWRTKFADKFTSGAVEKTDTSYKSANINVSIKKVQENGVTYFFADIYVADIKYFKTAFGVNPNTIGKTEHVDQSSKENNGIVAINGDNCSPTTSALIIRNTKIFIQKKSSADELVIYNDGTMQTFAAGGFDMNKIIAEAPYQAWTFGPMLLNNGQPMTSFNSTVKVADPRTAIGYYEPGHYCFVDVDGRQPGYSKGYTMTELSQKMHDLGCKVAFNLDGGGSTQMAFMGTTISSPCGDYRAVSDNIYITDQG